MIWDIILQDLQAQLAKDEFERYFKNILFDEKNSQSDLKILLAPNIFVANLIRRKFETRIANLFEKHTEIKPKIELHIAPKAQNEGEDSSEIRGGALDSRRDSESIFVTKIIQNKKLPIINPTFTFESFAVGESNRHAFNIAKIVAQNGGQSYNPLFISGSTGLGKTHLLNAIANVNLDKNVILLTCEAFVSDFTIHSKNKTFDKFRAKYRTCDYLLIDDIQFLEGKKHSQDEFFNTFNELKDNKKQIVLISDREVKELDLGERLKSRFQSGVIVKITEPDLETNIRIIEKKCELEKITLSNEITHHIAANIKDTRILVGLLATLKYQSTLTENSIITLQMAKNCIQDYKKSADQKATLENIINATAANLNLKPSDIKSKKRSKDILLARKIVIFLGKNVAESSMAELANLLDLKDHSAISKALKNAQNEIDSNPQTKGRVEEIKNKILGNF